MDSTVLKALQVDPQSVKRLLDFLPYPFLIAIKKDNHLYNWFVNKRFQDEIGFPLEEIATVEEWFLYAYPDEPYRNMVRQSWAQQINEALQRGQDSAVARVRLFTRNNGYKWYEVKSSLTGDFQFIAFVNVNDVMERDLELERINENKNRILSILGHDLRTPINNLNKLTEFMLRTDLNAPDFVDHVSKVHELSKLTLQFLETTLIWTRSNFDRVSPRQDSLQLKPWLEQLVQLYESVAAARHIRFVVDVEQDKRIVTDGEILHIVMRNLVTNAIKFSDSNTPIHFSIDTHEEHFALRVRDSGKGMDASTVDAILADKFDARNVPSLRGGYGIGLRLCKDVLKGIGGELRIESKPNSGTTVSVLLPAK